MIDNQGIQVEEIITGRGGTVAKAPCAPAALM
jgi:hypothetical protein